MNVSRRNSFVSMLEAMATAISVTRGIGSRSISTDWPKFESVRTNEAMTKPVMKACGMVPANAAESTTTAKYSPEIIGESWGTAPTVVNSARMRASHNHRKRSPRQS